MTPLILVSGCAASPAARSDDCDGLIAFEGSSYRIEPRAIHHVDAGDELGTGRRLDCDEREGESVAVHRVHGVSPATAIAVPDGSEPDVHVVWVAEGVRAEELPDRLLQDQGDHALLGRLASPGAVPW